MRKQLNKPKNSISPGIPPGKVFLVGSGPGALDLLTIKAARVIAEAQVVIYDYLVGSDILTLVSSEAKLIYAGKKSNNHTLKQEEINALLVTHAQQGKQVVRLKGGDPFIFGRGGEEISILSEQGIPFEVVPGVTAACGAAAFAGIPLTHREHAQSCLFVTGHLKNGTIDLDWAALTRPKQTVVIYMGLGALPEISHQLLAAGISPETPVACIGNATLANQITITSDIANIANEVKQAKIKPPALLIIGSVVTLHNQLNWFLETHCHTYRDESKI